MKNGFELAYLLVIASSLIVIFAYDLKHYIIPDKILFPAVLIGVLYLLVFRSESLINHLFAVLVGAGFFSVLFFGSKGKWMGFGDVELAFLMGLLLGFPNILVGLFSAFLLGAIIGLVMILVRKKGLKSEIPFGPFLVIGTFIALFLGSGIISWYLNIL